MLTPTDILTAPILVVDDKESNVRLIEGMLRIAGYTCVSSTTNPRDVGALHRSNRYALILLDLQMPGMDGFQVMEGLKEIEGAGYLPVLVLTAQPDHKLRALEAGARDFVSKPFDFAELRARVRNILEVRVFSDALARTVLELEATREALRLKTLDEQKQRERELTLAQETQLSLLPATIPDFENYEVCAFNRPTRYVGGDFYDFLPLAEGEWMGVLADVAGKGMPAALLSSLVLGALTSEFRAGASSSDALGRLNKLLCEKSMPAQFVTLFLFLLGPGGSGSFVSAAHNPAYVYRSASGEIEKLVSDSHFIGIFDFAVWRPRPFRLGLNDILVVYSDGLTDAENPEQESFGEDRLLEAIRQYAPAGGNAIEQGLLDAVGQFTGETLQNDDITLLIVEKNA